MKKTTSMQINPALLTASPELMEIQSIMPISNEDRSRLEKDIKENGIRDAIKVYQTEDGEFKILGGLNRHEIATALNIEAVPIDIYEGTAEDYRALVKNDNLSRRHMTSAQKRLLIEHELISNPEKSNRQIAEETKTTHVTVAKVRKEKEEQGALPVMDKTVGKDGVERTATPKKPETPPLPKTSVKKTIKCPHCGEEITL